MADGRHPESSARALTQFEPSIRQMDPVHRSATTLCSVSNLTNIYNHGLDSRVLLRGCHDCDYPGLVVSEADSL